MFSATKVCLTLSSTTRSTVSTQWFVSLCSKLMTWRVLLCKLSRSALNPFIVTQMVVDYCYQVINSQLLLIGVVIQLRKYFEHWKVNSDIPRCMTHTCTCHTALNRGRQSKWSDFTDPVHWMHLDCLFGTLYTFWNTFWNTVFLEHCTSENLKFKAWKANGRRIAISGWLVSYCGALGVFLGHI